MLKMRKYLSLLLFLQVLLVGSESRSVTSRIYDGVISEPNSRPYQVGIYKRVGTTGELGFCGGTLIDSSWILTAAHCCYHGDEEVTNVQVILGAHSLYNTYENGRRIVNVEQIIVHPDYDNLTHANDIALMKLANFVQITDTISPVRLPYQNISSNNFAGMAATASGWGIAAEGVSFLSPTLRQKWFTVTTDTYCNTTYTLGLPYSAVCGYDANSGTCKGDNGGPFTIYYNQTEEDILIGVTSFVGADGCTSGKPSVFTRVQGYLYWINSNTGIQLL